MPRYAVEPAWDARAVIAQAFDWKAFMATQADAAAPITELQSILGRTAVVD